jgi:hypothetical protein
MGERNENVVYPSPWNFKGSFTCSKFLHGTFRLSSPWPGSATFQSSGKHTNQFTTKAASIHRLKEILDLPVVQATSMYEAQDLHHHNRFIFYV